MKKLRIAEHNFLVYYHYKIDFWDDSVFTNE